MGDQDHAGLQSQPKGRRTYWVVLMLAGLAAVTLVATIAILIIKNIESLRAIDNWGTIGLVAAAVLLAIVIIPAGLTVLGTRENLRHRRRMGELPPRQSDPLSVETPAQYPRVATSDPTHDSIYCIHCGALVENPDQVFCMRCGHHLR